MSRFNPSQWGQTRKINPGEWNVDPHNPSRTTPLTIVTKDGANPHEVQNAGELPWTKNLTLGVDFDPNESGTFALHWVITFGVGGGTEDFEIDAAGLQQLSLSADLLRVSLVATQPSIGSVLVETPTKPISATAFYTQGATDTDPPTLTQRFEIPDGLAGITLPVPKFASGFRLLGLASPADGGSATSPFQADVFATLQDFSGTGQDQYAGTQLYDFRLAEIPTGISTAVKFTNGTGGLVVAGVEWFIDC